MGKRSRKRGGPATSEQASSSGSSRAERDAARARRAQAAERRRSAGAGGRSAAPARRRGRPTIDERPPAPWGKFPLVELVVLVALILLPLSLELSIREHFAGYRSHTALLAGAAAFASMAVLFILGGKSDVTRALMIPIGGLVFIAAFWLLREAFKRRSGGLGFR
ncbi:MAG: hypothetical protein E6G07_01105 [Actinobacteria bacterium]|nr:MAG: hypothetical protein E6G07_01105 [Actinomycetota bacterium]